MTKSFKGLLIGAALAAVLLMGTAATLYTGYRTTTELSTNHVALVNYTRGTSGVIYTISATNLLEGLMALPNWPAAGAGDVTASQLNAASNAVVLIASNLNWVASNALRGDITANTAYTLAVSNAAYVGSNALRADLTAGTAYTLAVSNYSYTASNALWNAMGGFEADTVLVSSSQGRITTGAASAQAVSYVANLTSDAQAQLNAKQAATAVTNYAHATTLTIQASADVKASVTNDTSADVAVTFSTPVPGKSGRLVVTGDGSARTISFLCSGATLTPAATNNMVNTTNVQTTASKRMLICWDVNRKTATETNILYWAVSIP